MMKRLQSGQQGEQAAGKWFAENGWQMVRTQPAIRILGSKPGARYGRIFTVCMVGKGGVPDYTGYQYFEKHHFSVSSDFKTWVDGIEYRACEVKEASGDSMPASRLDKAQREFMKRLPEGCAFVGVFWADAQKFEMFKFLEHGSYRKG